MEAKFVEGTEVFVESVEGFQQHSLHHRFHTRKLFFFTFKGNFFRPTKGVVMGTKMAPYYENIYMGNLGKEILLSL